MNGALAARLRRLAFLPVRLRLRGRPRFRELRVAVGGLRLRVPDALSFRFAYEEIFLNEIYRFPFSGGAPRILDLGANIGLSALYFKRRYPGARIVAVEADPAIFACLRENLAANGAGDVELVHAAAWTHAGTVAFTPEGADSGAVGAHGGATLEVPALDLRRLLQERAFDFVKMDVEGAENELVPACAAELARVPFVFIEYHSRAGEPQRLAEVLASLREAGFRVHAQTLTPRERPFEPRAGAYDLQVNLFARRAP